MIDRQLEQLIGLFSKLPGLGPRSARRVVLHLLKHRETHYHPLTQAMLNVQLTIQHCESCRNLDACNPCAICSDAGRDQRLICVVEDVADLWAIERTKMHTGRYHVLTGTLSAIDGMGPEQLGIPMLIERAQKTENCEVILATNTTLEGQTTAHYISQRLQDCNVKVTRLALGIPMGGELDYLDDGTLSAAFMARHIIPA
jgi:recombination protein RecR